MREGWEYKKLGEVASSELGKTLNKSKDTGKLYPYICAVNVLWDMIDLTILKHAFFEKEEIDRYSVRKGDLLVCEGGDTGRSAIWEEEEPVLYQNALHRVRFTTEMEARFAMYCLWHLKNNGQIDQKYSKGVTIKHLVKSSLLSIELPVPPLSTQLSIVSELDKINELIRLKKEQLKDYDNLAQSIFYEMFGDPVENEKGWEVKKFGEVASFKNGLNFGKNENGYSYKILGVGDFKDNYVVNSSLLEYINLNDELSSDYFLKSGDIVFVRSNGSKELVGRCVSVDCNEPTTYSGFCIRCRLDENSGVLPMYLLYVCKNKGIREYLTQSGRGCNISNVNQKILNSTDIIIPPLSKQELFIQRIELIVQQKAEVQRTIKDLETLLASRMQYWFD